MIDLLILLIFLLTGAGAGLIGLKFLPTDILGQVLFVDRFIEQSVKEIDIKILLVGFGSLFGLLAGLILQGLRKRLLRSIRTMPTDLLVSRAGGLIIGLFIANLILAPILLLPLPKELIIAKPFAAILSNLFFGVIGFNLGEVHGRTLLRIFNPNSTEALLITEGILKPATAKILDTSVIIDGRVNELLDCGILEGQVIVAQTVIDELQQLADSSNNEKRAKGRRGLKLLTILREKYGKRLVISSTKYDEEDTDNRLLKLTESMSGTLITADYNLSKVAQVKEIKVLNLSDLVIALRADVQPGEKINLKIVREGKEGSQGIGYLDDGTMVVIEGAKELIGDRKSIVITGELQTSTGRMIFGKLDKIKSSGKSHKSNSPKSQQSS